MRTRPPTYLTINAIWDIQAKRRRQHRRIILGALMLGMASIGVLIGWQLALRDARCARDAAIATTKH